MQALPMIAQAASVVGTMVSMSAAQSQAKYQAQVAENNAKLAEINANETLRRSQIDAQIQDQEAQAEIGSIVAAASASGFDLNVGSTALRRRTAENLAGRDRAFMIQEGEDNARAYRQQGENFRADAKATRYGGKLQSFSALLNGISSFPNLLSDAPKVAPSTAKVYSTNRYTVRPRPRPVVTF